MSRCFPFPPPGFELKARPDDVNLIIKEKKEKKKKKHKDKDKKERSKRKENERSEGDHKENKKRKREKDKDKKERKRKKKDKQISSEGKEIVGFLENQNGGELVTDSKTTDAIHDKGCFPESGKRIIKDGGALGSQMVQKIAAVEKSNVNLDKTERSKMANGQSFNVDVRRLGNGYIENANQLVQKIAVVEKKVNLDKTEGSKMANGQSFNVDVRRLGNGYVGNCNGESRIKIEGGSCQVDKVENRTDRNGWNGYGTVFGKGDGSKNEDTKAKERNGYRNIVGEGNGCKNEDQNKNTRALEKKENEKMTQDRKEKIKQGPSDFNFLFRANNPLKDGQGKLTKHKELNGFLHGVRPNNTSRPALPCPVEKGAVINNQKGNDKISSPQSVINNHGLSNGHHIHIQRKMEPCTPPTNTVAKVNPIVKNHSAVDKVPSTHPLLENGRTIHKTDIKELRTNGSVEGGKHTTSSKPSIKSKDLKPPHPDLKYLSSIYCVPHEVELPQCDDQDWLFGCKDKRPKLASSPNHCTKQVWAEAIQLESVDITALPYVIPY